MRKLIIELQRDPKKQDIPNGFREVILSEATGWDYWQIVSQPSWFIDKMILYKNAKSTSEEIVMKKEKSKQKVKSWQQNKSLR